MRNRAFSVSRFKNRNGVFSWRVDGYLNGVRFRRNSSVERPSRSASVSHSSIARASANARPTAQWKS